MAARKQYGRLNLAAEVGRGENPNGMVTQAPNGTLINGAGFDVEPWDYQFGRPASGSRWNKTELDGRMAEIDVARPTGKPR